MRHRGGYCHVQTGRAPKRNAPSSPGPVQISLNILYYIIDIINLFKLSLNLYINCINADGHRPSQTVAGLVREMCWGGAAQIGRGVYNTPQAFRGRREQRVWDADLGQWVSRRPLESHYSRYSNSNWSSWDQSWYWWRPMFQGWLDRVQRGKNMQ